MKLKSIKLYSAMVLSTVLLSSVTPTVTVLAQTTNDSVVTDTKTSNTKPLTVEEVKKIANDEHLTNLAIYDNLVKEYNEVLTRVENYNKTLELTDEETTVTDPKQMSGLKVSDVSKSVDEHITLTNSNVETYTRLKNNFIAASNRYTAALDEYNKAKDQFTADHQEYLAKKQAYEEALTNYNQQKTAFEEQLKAYNEALNNLNNYEQTLREYEERKAAYEANRNEIIKYNKDNASLEVISENGKTTLDVKGNNYKQINIQKIFTPENAMIASTQLNKNGDSVTIVGEEGVDVKLTVINWESVLDTDKYPNTGPFSTITRYDEPIKLSIPKTTDLSNNIKEPIEFNMQFIDHATGQPVNIVTLFDTTDFDQSEILSFKSDTGTALVVDGVRSTSENGDWLSFNGGYAPTTEVGIAGARTAFSGSDVTIKLENYIAYLGIFKHVDFEARISQLKEVPGPFTEQPPVNPDNVGEAPVFNEVEPTFNEAEPVFDLTEPVLTEQSPSPITIQGMFLSDEDKERLKPVEPTISEQSVKFKTIYKADDSLEFEKQQITTIGVDGVSIEVAKYEQNDEGVYTKQSTIHNAPVTDEIVNVGNVKTETKPIAYKSETRENPSLNEGEKRIVQEGKDGVETTVSTYKVNSETGELSDPEVKVTKTDAVNEIVEVGTKKEAKALPETGDSTSMLITISGLLLSAVAGFAAVTFKRRTK